MLVLTRKPGQRLLINDEISLVVLAVDGDRVRLGIEAPRHISVLRAELVEAVGSENRAAASLAADRPRLDTLLHTLRGG